MPETVASAVRRVTARVTEAAGRAGRDPAEITIVAAIKTIDREKVAKALEAGIVDIGVNRAQDFRDQAPALGPRVRWHYLGSVQTNKVRYLDDVVLIHSVAREREVQALHERAERIGRTREVLIEVNVAGERRKQGVAPDEIEGLLEACGRYPQVVARGLMFMAPQVQNPEDVRWLFVEGKRLLDRFEHYGLVELSMGMSEDFEVAVEEGATIVRIGRSIFAPTLGKDV